MGIYKVTVADGESFRMLAVHATTKGEAERKAEDYGFFLVGAITYQIGDYGVKFCAKVIR